MFVPIYRLITTLNSCVVVALSAGFLHITRLKSVNEPVDFTLCYDRKANRGD